jgi:hypothetical protein
MKAITSTIKQKVDNRVGHGRIGPTCGFVASPEVGPRATIGRASTHCHVPNVSGPCAPS